MGHKPQTKDAAAIAAAVNDAVKPKEAAQPAKAGAPDNNAPAADDAKLAGLTDNNAPAADDAKLAELTDTLKRLQADFENHIKQADKRQAQVCEQASARVLVRILAIVDEFERSLKTLEDAKIDPVLLEGMRMVNKNVHAVLDAEGVIPIDCVGKKIDPFRHDVLRKIKKEGKEDDIIIEEHVRGYLLKDKVLRHSKVTVVQNGGDV